jgi:hypothetical protein
VALAGLALIGGAEADALLELLSAKGDPEIATAAQRLAQQRRTAGGAS